VTCVAVAAFRFLYYKQANKNRGKVSPFVTSRDKKRNGPVFSIQYNASNPLTIAGWTSTVSCSRKSRALGTLSR
jgi:hypothetical protein